MIVLFFMIPIALALGLFSLMGFFWSVHDGQYDDLDTPAYRMLNKGDKDK